MIVADGVVALLDRAVDYTWQAWWKETILSIARWIESPEFQARARRKEKMYEESYFQMKKRLWIGQKTLNRWFYYP
jgi:hypothetical protein